MYPSEIPTHYSFSYIDFYHTMKDGRNAGDRQSLLECITARSIKHYRDLVLHERSKDPPECHTDPGKRPDIGLD